MIKEIDEIYQEEINKYSKYSKEIINKINKIVDTLIKELEKIREDLIKKINEKLNPNYNVMSKINNLNQMNLIELSTLKNQICKIKSFSFELNPNINIDSIKENIKILQNLIQIGDKSNKLQRFKEGPNYKLSNNNKKATKISGGSYWNCNVLGDLELKKGNIYIFKIRVNNIDYKINSWCILIGICEENLKPNEFNGYTKSWTFNCGQSKLSIKSESLTPYNNNYNNKIKKGDIITIITNMKEGTLSFEVNGTNYGIATNKLPVNEKLRPIVLISEENCSVEIID